jgi:hypothetical protein
MKAPALAGAWSLMAADIWGSEEGDIPGCRPALPFTAVDTRRNDSSGYLRMFPHIQTARMGFAVEVYECGEILIADRTMKTRLWHGLSHVVWASLDPLDYPAL